MSGALPPFGAGLGADILLLAVLTGIKPLRLIEQPEPFDNEEWIFELKHDGFRAVAYVNQSACRLVSRNGHPFDQFGPLCQWLASHLEVKEAVLDGEIVCLGSDGRSQFYDLLGKRGHPLFYAFDLLWLDGRDLRDEPLLGRKRRLEALVPAPPSRLLYVDHLEALGSAFFRQVCAMDLEGIIAKRRHGLYREGTRWIKIKNPTYSQAEGRGELFNQRRPKGP